MTRRRSRRDEAGAVAVLVAAIAIALFVIAGLVADLGFARDVKRQSQIAADASALAGGNVLYPGVACTEANPAGGTTQPCIGDAVKAIKDYARVNYRVQDADWSDTSKCHDDHPLSYLPDTGQRCISFDSSSSTTKVRVLMPAKTVKPGLGGLAGVEEIPIVTGARASLTPGQTRSCGLCILGNGPHSLGNGDGVVTNGSIWSNGALTGNPNGSMTSTGANSGIHVIGGCTTINCSPAATVETVPINDPFSSLSLPPNTSMLPAALKTNPCTQGPGFYGSYTVGATDTCTLSPGLYVVTGTWYLQATNSKLMSNPLGTGVTLYVTCTNTSGGGLPRPCTGTEGANFRGHLDMKNGTTTIQAPTTSPSNGALAGMAVIYDRLNTSALDLQGNGGNVIKGTIYAKSATLEFPGTTEFTIDSGTIVVGSLYGNGNTGKLKLTNAVNAALESLPPAGLHLDE